MDLSTLDQNDLEKLYRGCSLRRRFGTRKRISICICASDRLTGEHAPPSMFSASELETYRTALSGTKSWAKRVYRALKGEWTKP